MSMITSSGAPKPVAKAITSRTIFFPRESDARWNMGTSYR
jgi:hypothetical protein